MVRKKRKFFKTFAHFLCCLKRVNFTNVLRAAFTQVSCECSFFVLKFQVCTLLAQDCWRKSCTQNVGEIVPRLLSFLKRSQQNHFDPLSCLLMDHKWSISSTFASKFLHAIFNAFFLANGVLILANGVHINFSLTALLVKLNCKFFHQIQTPSRIIVEKDRHF